MKEILKRNAKDQVFKNLLHDRKILAQFYNDLTGRKIKPEDIKYDTIAKTIVKGQEEDIAFQIGSIFIILIEAQSSWKIVNIIRFACYMFQLFLNFIDDHIEEIFESGKNITIPAVEAYIIYTGSRDLPEEVSLKNFPNQVNSMINASMKIVSLKNAIGYVEQYIKFSMKETEYYNSNKRTKSDIIELIDYCINNNILKEYLIKHSREVINMIENYFTEERRIQSIVNDEVNKAINEEQQKHKIELEKEQQQRKIEKQKYKMELEKEQQQHKIELNKEQQKYQIEQQKLKIELREQREKNIIDLAEKLKMSPEEIANFTESSVDYINEVLDKNKHS